MTTYIDRIKVSGTHVYSHLTADSDTELRNMARRLKLTLKKGGSKGKIDHLDLDPHKRELALRYGALEASNDQV